MAKKKRKAEKSRRRRVSREQTRKNARDGSGGGQNWLVLPKGVKQYAPEKPCRVKLDILPYEVSTNHHPDGIEKGLLWYKYPFRIHHSIGSNEESIVCPGSIGKACPICQEVKKLKENYDENEETIKGIQGQRYVMYNILDPDDYDKIAVFCMSRGKFADQLEKELNEGEEEDLDFYHVVDGGKTVEVRFSEETFKGRKFVTASRIDFIPRDDMDEEEILEMTVNLDKCLKVLDINKIKDMFHHLDEGDEDEIEDEDDFEEETPPKKSKKKKKKKEPEEDEDDFEDEIEDEEDENVDFEDDDFDDDDSEEEEPPKKSKKKNKKKKKTKESEDDDDFDDDTEKEPEAEEEEDDDDFDDDDFDNDPPPPPKKKKKKEPKEKKKTRRKK